MLPQEIEALEPEDKAVISVEGEGGHVFYMLDADGNYQKFYKEPEAKFIKFHDVASFIEHWAYYSNKHSGNITDVAVYMPDQGRHLSAELVVERGTDHGTIQEIFVLYLDKILTDISWAENQPIQETSLLEKDKLNGTYETFYHKECSESCTIQIVVDDEFRARFCQDSVGEAKASALRELKARLSKEMNLPVFYATYQ